MDKTAPQRPEKAASDACEATQTLPASVGGTMLYCSRSALNPMQFFQTSNLEQTPAIKSDT